MILTLLLAVSSVAIDICPSGFSSALEPQVAVSADRLYVGFGMGSDIYVSSSTNMGASFAQPVKVAHLDSLMLGMRRGPRLAVNGNSLVVTAVGTAAGGNSNELWAWRSLDGGKIWSSAAQINDVPKAAQEGLDGLGFGGGKYVCAWLDGRTEGTKLYASDSTDGVHWSKNRLVYASPSGSICQCCHPTVAVDEAGNASYLFRNLREGNRDMYLARDGEPARRLDHQSWPLSACPMDGGDMILANRVPVAVWRRENRVLVGSNGKVSPGGVGQQPVLAMSAGGLVVAFVSLHGGALSVGMPNGPKLSNLSQHADDPSIASLPNGEVFVAWTETGVGLRAQSVR